MNSSHCNDADLLSYLDGELSIERWQEVSSHLESCWKCRSRAHAFDAGIAELNETLAGADLVIEDSQDRVRHRLLARMEPSRPDRLESSHRAWRSMLLLVAAGAAAAAVTKFLVTVPLFSSSGAPLRPLPLKITSPSQSRQFSASAKFVPSAPVVNRALRPLPPPRLDDLEVELRFRLHASGLDMSNGSLSFSQTGKTVRVSGVVDSEGQRTELQSALRQVSRPQELELDLLLPSKRTPRVLASSTAAGPASIAKPAATELKASLLAAFGTEQRLTEVGNRSVALVEQMTDYAWALHNLALRFPAQSVRKLLPENQDRLSSIQRDYAGRIIELAGRLHETLAILPPLPASAAARDPLELAARVFALRGLVEGIFAAASPAAPVQKLDDIRQVLNDGVAAISLHPASESLAGLAQTKGNSNH